jgi:ABC-2 type transport system permease protein
MSFGYLILEVRRAVRSVRFMIFAIAFPVLMFLLYTGIWGAGDESIVGVLMVNMTAFGALSAALSAGGRVAQERAVGWQRQLRLTPLSGPGYLTAKGITAMMLAIPAVVLVPLVGALIEGVSLDATGWLRVVLGTWLAVIPFALLGLLVGQLATPDSLQPITTVVMLVLSMIGGIFIPIDSMPGWMLDIAHVLPSYWLGQIARGAVTTDMASSLGTAVLVLAAWSVGLAVAVTRRYRRDSARV